MGLSSNEENDGQIHARTSLDECAVRARGRRGCTSIEQEGLGDRASESALSKEIHAPVLLEDLARLAATDEPVALDTFRRRSSTETATPLCAQLRSPGSGTVHGVDESPLSPLSGGEGHSDVDGQDDGVDIELLDAYVAYCRSVGHKPNIRVDPSSSAFHSLDSTIDESGVTHVQEKIPIVQEPKHFWTKIIGTRFSKRRGCTQFWAWMLIGVGVLTWLGISLSALQLNEVLHLDAFTVQNVQVTQDYTFLHFLEEVDFHLTYTIETPAPKASASPNSSYFNALLLNEYEYAHYVDGEPFEYIAAGSTLRTTYAYLPHTYIENVIKETMYFVVQPCFLERNPTAYYCSTTQLPTSVHSSEKIYNLDQKKKMRKKAEWEHFNVTYMSVNPMPVACSSSGWLGGSYLLLFLPYLLIVLFGLRVAQMIRHCEGWKQNIERIYLRELKVPENEVDYWQPMPWDRKVPKTRLCGPCCWKKFRRPFEPFYTWWRHENYFTWIFCPYRNERLSRGERALIVVCSLYVTFYVLFIIVMLRDSWGANITIFTSVVLYAILVSVLPAAGKAVFKELFKLIFRQRRKYFRAKAAGGDLSGFSFRLAFLLQVLVVVLLTLAQAPIFYIWAFRSCLFLKKFMWFGVLAAIMRMSLMGLVQDFAWYLIIQTWGWKDLCPYCTERIAHCDCFNDEVLVLGVQHVGPKWELIRVLDELLAKQNRYEPQFALYTAEQLRERWDVIVERAEKHMEEVEKLRAYQEKKRQDALRHDRIRRSFTSFLSFQSTTQAAPASENSNVNGEAVEERRSASERSAPDDDDVHLCNLREKKILALNSKIKLDEFEKHYDSTISDVFHALARSVTRRRRHEKHEHSDAEQEGEDKGSPRTPLATRQSSSDSSSDGETMWVFDTPAQRLERREEEKLQRKRAFRVLKNYNIESVASSSEHSVLAAPTSSPSRVQDQVERQDSRRAPLLSTPPRDEDLVILIPDARSKSNRDNLDGVANARVDDDYDDADSDLERGQSTSQGVNRVYTVTERPKTLLRRMSTSATAFAAWALDYDPQKAS